MKSKIKIIIKNIKNKIKNAPKKKSFPEIRMNANEISIHIIANIELMLIIVGIIFLFILISGNIHEQCPYYLIYFFS